MSGERGAARLILLNGPPAVGKSTLARRFVAAHPLALNLDIDQLRGMLGGWQDEPMQAGLLARAIAIEAARTHLAAGFDVVIPQLLCRAPFIEALAGLAREQAVAFHEVVLMDSKENALRRFRERTAAAAEPAHLEAQEQLARSGGFAELAAMYDRLQAVIAARPATKLVTTEAGEIDQAYQDFLAVL